MESARTATREDVERLRELWDQADAEVGLQRGGERLIGSITRPVELDGPRRGSETLIADPDRVVIVGCLDEIVFGFAAAAVDRRPVVPVAVLDVAFVEDDARRVGLGEAILLEVLAWAAARGCEGVDAYALPGSRMAKAFFESNAFVARLLVMHRPLRPGTDD